MEEIMLNSRRWEGIICGEAVQMKIQILKVAKKDF